MSDVTFGVKVSPEMKEELLDLIKNNDGTAKDFMALMLQSYKLEKSKQTLNLSFSEIDELQKLLKRVQSIYLNLHEKAEGVITEQKNQFETSIEGYQTIVDEKLSLIAQLEKSVEEKESEIKQCEDVPHGIDLVSLNLHCH